MQKCLVTGGAGFIGSNLAERLLGDSVQVTVLDNLTTGFMENLEPFLGDIEFKQGDVRDLDTLQEVMVGVEVVFHQAAVVSVPQSVENPIEAAMVNDLGTLYVLEAARRAGVRGPSTVHWGKVRPQYLGDGAPGKLQAHLPGKEWFGTRCRHFR